MAESVEQLTRTQNDVVTKLIKFKDALSTHVRLDPMKAPLLKKLRSLINDFFNTSEMILTGESGQFPITTESEVVKKINTILKEGSETSKMISEIQKNINELQFSFEALDAAGEYEEEINKVINTAEALLTYITEEEQ